MMRSYLTKDRSVNKKKEQRKLTFIEELVIKRVRSWCAKEAIFVNNSDSK